ncbi:hypothetical protein PG993_011448 [Apiospora rasikravindrae]|uniref:Transmembrane protein n=1 Tax=Apiospora rasikravindrae TaxID=990691 RepID=A0ABR1SE97_9PEZI
MHQQHESLFNYNITRPFPYKWFTPLAVIGGLVLGTLFTLLNFASAGFLLEVEASTNPNATVSEKPLQVLPSYLTSKIKPTCQPVTLPVGTKFFTNQTALMYTLTGVWEESRGGSGQTVAPSLTYQQNLLEDCSINSIQIDIASQDRAANQLALTEWGAEVRTFVTCSVATTRGPVFLNLTQTYDYVPGTVSFAQIGTFLGSGFVSRDQQARASLWWGESLMSTYWAQMTWLLQKETRSVGSKHYPIRKGTLSFVPRPEAEDITSTGFFGFSSQFIEATSPGSYVYPHAEGTEDTLADLIRKKTYPNIWGPAEKLAKSVHSTILTDLGQTSTRPNLLTDAATLEAFSSDLPSAQKSIANANPGPATQSYNELKHLTGPLAVNPSVISAQYICQVPRRRSTVSLVVAVLAADLVFLQAAWKLYDLVAGLWLKRNGSTFNWCRGCLEEAGGRFMVAPPTPGRMAPGKPYEMVRQRDVEI